MKKIIGIIIAAVIIALIVTMSTVITERSLERSDATIERIDRILDEYGR